MTNNHDNNSLQMPTINPYLYSIKLFDGHGHNNIVYMDQQILSNTSINNDNNHTEQDIYTINLLQYLESLLNHQISIQNSINSLNKIMHSGNSNNNIIVENLKDIDIDNIKLEYNNNNNNSNSSNNNNYKYQTPPNISNQINLNSSPIPFNLNESLNKNSSNRISSTHNSMFNSPKVQLSTSNKKNRSICKGIFLNGKPCPYFSQLGKLYCLAHDPHRRCQFFIGASRCSKSTIGSDSKYCLVHNNIKSKSISTLKSKSKSKSK